MSKKYWLGETNSGRYCQSANSSWGEFFEIQHKTFVHYFTFLPIKWDSDIVRLTTLLQQRFLKMEHEPIKGHTGAQRGVFCISLLQSRVGFSLLTENGVCGRWCSAGTLEFFLHSFSPLFTFDLPVFKIDTSHKDKDEAHPVMLCPRIHHLDCKLEQIQKYHTWN